MKDAMISIIVPAYNEQECIIKNIQTVADTMQSYGEYEIILVDDGSTDDTYLLALNKLKISQLYVYRKIKSCGKGAALRTGLKFAAGDYIVFLDADLQIMPDELKTFFKIMELYNADVVIGNKRHDYSNVDYPFFRRIISMGYKFIIKLLFQISLKDTQCGIKLFKRAAVDKIKDKLSINGLAFDVELIVALTKAGIRIADAPVNVSRPLGLGSVSCKNIFQALRDLLWIKFGKR